MEELHKCGKTDRHKSMS